MDGIGKMYNPNSPSSGDSGRIGSWVPTPRRPDARPLPEHTESFYRTLREAAREKAPEPCHSSPVPEKVPESDGHKCARSCGRLGGSSLFGLEGLTSLLKKVGSDDILILLLMVLLLGEADKDGMPLLLILGMILLS